jgi:hypothetical protein
LPSTTYTPSCYIRGMRGSRPIRAKTYGKDSLRPSIWGGYASEGGDLGLRPGDIAQNHGVQLAVGAMFADEPAYFAQ